MLPPISTPENSPTLLRQAWLIVALLFPVALLNYLDRQMLAGMKISMMRDIPDVVTEEKWGMVLAQFKWAYAIVSPFGGWLADRFGRRWIICGSLLVWSFITWMTGQVTTYEGLLWVRTTMGLSEACYIPAALALISDFHPGNTRSKATGLHQIGIYVGVIIGGFAGYAADHPSIGWRGAFWAAGLAGIAYAFVLMWLLPKNTALAAGGEAGGESPVKDTSAVRDMLRQTAFWCLLIYFALPGIAGWVVRDWMPAILQKEFNISQGKAGVSAALYWQSAAIGSALLGGWLADRWRSKSVNGRVNVSMIGLSCLIPALFMVGNAPAANSFGLAIAGLILFGLGWGWFDINNMPILCQIARPQARATGYGILNLVGLVVGGGADWIFGWLKDRHVPLNVTFAAFAGIVALAVAAGYFLRAKPAPATS